MKNWNGKALNTASRPLLAAALAILLSATAGFAQTHQPSQGKAGADTPPTDRNQAAAIQAVAVAGRALVAEFEVNGLKVLVKRRMGSQSVATGLFIRGGAQNLTAGNAGIEALMLSVATEASQGFPRERMRSELARMGTGIRSSSNYDYSVLSMVCTRANFERSWQVFADSAMRPSFTADDVMLVKNRMLTSLRDDSDVPDTFLQRLQESVAYIGHPYLNRPGGTVESLGSLSAGDLRAYHRRVMETSRLLLVIVGDLTAADLRERVSAAFGKLPVGTYRAAPPPPLRFASSTVDITPRSLPTNYVQGVFAAPSLTSPDILPMRIASTILQDRVFEEVRVRQNLSYAPSAFLNSQAANTGGIYVSAVDANRAVKAMLAEITRLQNEPIDSSDITGVIAQFLTTYYLRQETNAAQAAELAQFELIGGGWRTSFEIFEKLRAVTPEDVQRVARTYMRNIRFVVLGEPAAIDKTIFTSQSGF